MKGCLGALAIGSETGHAARKLQAAVLAKADRDRFVWNNYRQRKCGLDY